MKEIVTDTGLIAYCGLYCGACGRYRKDRCPGCHENEKAAWCRVRTCCRESEAFVLCGMYCFADPKDCESSVTCFHGRSASFSVPTGRHV